MKIIVLWSVEGIGEMGYEVQPVEDILAENIIGRNWENYWLKTIDQKDSSNFACILHPNTFPEKANLFFSHDILVFGGVASL